VKKFVIACIAIGILAMSIGVVMGRWLYGNDASRRSTSLAQKALWFDRFCLGTFWAVRKDREAFESKDTKRINEASERFYESQVLFHGAWSVSMCLDEKVPDTPSCWRQPDTECLAKFARTLEGKLEALQR
jgi:hypothetical protein